MPVLVDGRRHFHQPTAVLGEFENIHGGKEFDPIRRWIAQWLQKPGRDQNRHIMLLAVQHPGGLLRREAGRKLPQQGKETMLVVSHIIPA